MKKKRIVGLGLSIILLLSLARPNGHALFNQAKPCHTGVVFTIIQSSSTAQPNLIEQRENIESCTLTEIKDTHTPFEATIVRYHSDRAAHTHLQCEHTNWLDQKASLTLFLDHRTLII